MKSILLFTTILFLAMANVNAQVSDDFSDGNLTDPTWVGMTEVFTVNEDKELQLNDDKKSESSIFVASDITGDIEWYVDVKLDFDPSTSNYCQVFLAMTDASATANGYYLKMGASKSTDAIELHKIANGKDTKIAEGTMGAVAKSPDLTIKATYVNGELNIYADYDKSGFFSPDAEITTTVTDLDAKYFGFGAKYSASRGKHFYFDNIVIKAYEPDTEGPKLAKATVESSTRIVLTFDEYLEENLSTSNFSLKNGPAVSNVTYDGNIVYLDFAGELSASGISTIVIKTMKDLEGNVSSNLEADFMYSKSPEKGDIVINEILTDPEGDGEDFIEVYNTTDSNISLKGCKIVNQSDSDEEIGDLVLLAKSYVALTPSAEDLKDRYNPIAEANIVDQELPSLNNSETTVTILNVKGDTLDRFDYTDDWHFELLDDTEGVSLERISAEVETQKKSNWHSAGEPNYGTPGYENGSKLDITATETGFTLVNPSFSPNNDGQEDVMGIQYSLDKAGYVSTVKVYDSSGYEIVTLQNNELLSTKGLITWDGKDKTGRIANIGIYVVVGEAFHTDGKVKKFKLAVSLLDYLK